MSLGNKVAVGSFVPDYHAAMYCWAHDVAAARLDGAFRISVPYTSFRFCASHPTAARRTSGGTSC